MALRKCKECGKEISTEASVCPNCGKKRPTASESHNWVWVAVAIVVLILAVNVFGSSTPSTPPKPPTPAQLAARRTADSAEKTKNAITTQLLGAVMLCHQAAEGGLKAPATAKWHDDEAYQKDLGKGRSHVQIEVDAENSFSALVRTTIDCRTQQKKNGDVVLTAIDSWQR